MYKALTQHPAILGAVLHKGVHYFDVAYDRPIGWYQAHFPLVAIARRRQYAGVIPITGESSPYYMFHPLAADRIARDLPGVKVIVLTRDPVERAYSAHAHELARGFEDVASFELAVQLEPDRLAGQDQWLRDNPTARSHSHQHHGYLARGRYIDRLEYLESVLGRDRIHVVDSHDFFLTPEPVYDAVIEFLGLPTAPYPHFAKHNGRDRSPMSTELREKLTSHFAPFDRRLADWLGWTPSWRR
jgi:hypothetical protein